MDQSIGNQLPYHREYYRYEEEMPVNYTARPGFFRFHPVRVGDTYNGYKVIRKLGYGTFSTVWLAEDMKLTLLYLV
jgi:serine/threonine protein kinase